MVELEEVDSVTGVNKEKTGELIFKTVAKPTVSSSLDKSNFKVSYHWNKIKQHIDLTKADIVLDTTLITYPSCLDNIQVSGSGVVVTTGPPLTRQRAVSPTRGRSLRYLNQGNGYDPLKTVNMASTLPGQISYSDVTRGSSSSSSSLPTPSTFP